MKKDFLPLFQENELLPPVNRWLTLGGLFLVGGIGAIIILSSLINYHVTVQTQKAIVIVSDGLKIVQTLQSGVVSDSFVSEGDMVNQGDKLALITNQDSPEIFLYAPVSGVITFINRNQILNNGDIYAEIFPSDSSLAVQAGVSSQDIAKVKLNQKVQLEITACPYSDYGFLQGKVKYIAPSSTKDTGLFKVIIEPSSSFFLKDNNSCFLKAGMEGQAKIFSEHRQTIWNFLLTQLK